MNCIVDNGDSLNEARDDRDSQFTMQMERTTIEQIQTPTEYQIK